MKQLHSQSFKVEQSLSRTKQLEGNCRIASIQMLQFSVLKTLILGSVVIMTVVGAILLYNFKKLRVFVFYLSAPNLGQATDIYIKDEQGRNDIQKIESISNVGKQFSFKKLRYWINEEGCYQPVCFSNQDLIDKKINQICQNGLSFDQVSQKLQMFGFNEHTVDTPNYFQYMVSVIFTPLYLLQYFVVIILSLQGLPLMGIILVLVSLITTSGNYIALYISNKKIKSIAEKVHRVRVIRQKHILTLDSRQLVPGDVFFVQNQIPCDALLIQGQAYMNQHSLTGESVPVGKISINNILQSFTSTNLLFQGTINIETGQNTKAMVIQTGFTTRKGKILRQILNRVPQQPDFFRKAVMFLIFSGIVVVILYFATLTVKLNSNIDRSLVWLSIVNFLLNAIPPAFPIYFTMAYSWSIYRLKQQGIVATMPQKTVQSNRLKVSCFDKTSTLTQNNILLDNIFLYEKQFKEAQHCNKTSQDYQLMLALFGTCHTVRKFNDQLLGDEVDLRMFQFSRFLKVLNSQVQTYEDPINKNAYEILNIHQFQSKFQSMSVLVQDKRKNKIFCFSKGAPEKMMKVSINKINKYQEFVADLALKGLRTIAFNYKQVPIQEVNAYKNCSREMFLENSRLIGLVTFENQLKFDTPQTIKSLRQASIDCKMITGDGIYIAVETAMRAGIISSSQKVFVIEGRKQDQTSRQKKIAGIVLTKTQQGYDIENQQIDYRNSTKIRSMNIAIDNDYLNMNPPEEIFLSASIFARTVPENKAKIIKMFKQHLANAWESQSLMKRVFGEGCSKVSMAGDGANDLLAIKEADVGVGISESDASYGAAFTVQNLGQIIDVVKEGKCTTQNIIENLRYVLIVNYLNVTIDILCSTQSTFLSLMMALFLNFFMITTLPIIAAYSKPNPQNVLTRHSAQDNFFGLENHLLTWGNIIILAVGLVGGFFYITRQPEYIPNPKPYWVLGQGYYPDCQLVTAMFLLIGLPLISTAVLVYKSQPWKNPIYRNIVLMVMLVIDLVIMTVFYAGNHAVAGLFGTVQLPGMSLFYLFLISISSQTVAFIYNYLVLKLLHPEYEQQNNPVQSIQKVEITQTNIDVTAVPIVGN